MVADCADAAVRMWLQAGAVDDALRAAAEGGDASTLAAAQEAKVWARCVDRHHVLARVAQWPSRVT